MPLLDHFHPPLSPRRDWHSLHNAWATYLASELNRLLPEEYFAAPNVQFGIEIDVATFEPVERGAGAVATWAAPAPTATLPFTLLTDAVEVLVYDTSSGRVLAAAVQLASPANKDRAAHRDAFVSKCATMLQQGIGLMLVDVVTGRHADLHSRLLERVSELGDEPYSARLYACSYRPVEREQRPALDLWHQPVAIGGLLPTLPLWLHGGLCVPVDLEATSERTRRELRLHGPES